METPMVQMAHDPLASSFDQEELLVDLSSLQVPSENQPFSVLVSARDVRTGEKLQTSLNREGLKIWLEYNGTDSTSLNTLRRHFQDYLFYLPKAWLRSVDRHPAQIYEGESDPSFYIEDYAPNDESVLRVMHTGVFVSDKEEGVLEKIIGGVHGLIQSLTLVGMARLGVPYGREWGKQPGRTYRQAERPTIPEVDRETRKKLVDPKDPIVVSPRLIPRSVRGNPSSSGQGSSITRAPSSSARGSVVFGPPYVPQGSAFPQAQRRGIEATSVAGGLQRVTGPKRVIVPRLGTTPTPELPGLRKKEGSKSDTVGRPLFDVSAARDVTLMPHPVSAPIVPPNPFPKNQRYVPQGSAFPQDSAATEGSAFGASCGESNQVNSHPEAQRRGIEDPGYADLPGKDPKDMKLDLPSGYERDFVEMPAHEEAGPIDLPSAWDIPDGPLGDPPPNSNEGLSLISPTSNSLNARVFAQYILDEGFSWFYLFGLLAEKGITDEVKADIALDLLTKLDPADPNQQKHLLEVIAGADYGIANTIQSADQQQRIVSALIKIVTDSRFVLVTSGSALYKICLLAQDHLVSLMAIHGLWNKVDTGNPDPKEELSLVHLIVRITNDVLKGEVKREQVRGSMSWIIDWITGHEVDNVVSSYLNNLKYLDGKERFKTLRALLPKFPDLLHNGSLEQAVYEALPSWIEFLAARDPSLIDFALVQAVCKAFQWDHFNFSMTQFNNGITGYHLLAFALETIVIKRPDLVDPVLYELNRIVHQGLSSEVSAHAAIGYIWGSVSSFSPDIKGKITQLLGSALGHVSDVVFQSGADVLHGLIRRNPDFFTASELLPLVKQYAINPFRSICLVSTVINPWVRTNPASMGIRELREFYQQFGETIPFKYTLFFLSTSHQVSPGMRQKAGALLGHLRSEKKVFPLHERIREFFGEGAKKILVVCDILIARGDEIIRTVPFLQAFLDSNPDLQATVVTYQPSLYQHPRVKTILPSRIDQLEDALQSGFDAVVKYTSTSGSEGVTQVVNNYRTQSPPFLYIESSNADIIKFNVEGQSYFRDLSVTAHAHLTTIYDAAFEVLCELGLPYAVGQELQKESILAGSLRNDAAVAWNNLVARNKENHPVVLYNPFGEERAQKGYVLDGDTLWSRNSVTQLRKNLHDLVAMGYYVILTPNDRRWGTPEVEDFILEGMDSSDTAHIVVSMRPGLLPEGTLPYFASYADVVISVEGGMIHHAFNQGKNPYAILMPQSGGFYWIPYGTHIISGLDMMREVGKIGNKKYDGGKSMTEKHDTPKIFLP